MYTYSQLILGNEYLRLPGNVERFFPLLLAMFLVAAWHRAALLGPGQTGGAASIDRPAPAGSGWLLIVIAAFVALGLHLPGLVDALREQPRELAYRELPNTFWVVKFYDLGIVVPAALAVGIGLLRRQLWARKPAYAILGGYVLLGWSVTGMAWTMIMNSDPDASLTLAIGFTAISVAGSIFAYYLYRQLFHPVGTGASRGMRDIVRTTSIGGSGGDQAWKSK